MIITCIADAIREARHANHRIIRHLTKNGDRDVGGMLYRQSEKANRDNSMAWARRYRSAAKTAANFSDRSLIVEINNMARDLYRRRSVELRAFRAEADRRRSFSK